MYRKQGTPYNNKYKNNTPMYYNKNIPVMTQIRQMQPQQVLWFPLEQILHIRGNISAYKTQYNMDFKTRINKEKRCFEVIRTQ